MFDIIDIRKLPVYVISVKTENERRIKISKILNNCGFLNWNFFDAIVTGSRSSYWIGCGLSHKTVLEKASFPCIVLEDDVNITEWFEPVLELPKNALTYLGLSSVGFQKGYAENNTCIFKPFNKKLNFVEYMLAAHAIYYSDKTAAKNFFEGILHELQSGRPFDAHYANMQSKILTYCFKKPLFYQDCDSNKVYTYFSID